MRLLKERKQNSCTPRTKTQGFEKKGGVKLKCTIGKGKIARFGLKYYIGKSEQPGSREIRVNNAQKNTRVTRVYERKCELIALSLPVSSQGETISQPGKILRNSILKDMFYKFTQIYLVRLLK